jgi:T5orf172 domain.
MKSKAGFVYVLSNEAMPGVVKIGMTARDPKVRLKEINSATGVLPFKLEAVIVSRNARWTEREVHKALEGHRINSKREFFRLDSKRARKIIFDIARKQHQKAYSGKKPAPNISFAMAASMIPATIAVHPIATALWILACGSCWVTGRPRWLMEFISPPSGLIPALVTGLIALAAAIGIQAYLAPDVIAKLSTAAHRLLPV